MICTLISPHCQDHRPQHHSPLLAQVPATYSPTSLFSQPSAYSNLLDNLLIFAAAHDGQVEFRSATDIPSDCLGRRARYLDRHPRPDIHHTARPVRGRTARWSVRNSSGWPAASGRSSAGVRGSSRACDPTPATVVTLPSRGTSQIPCGG
jgi:hypothetical protein